MREKRIGQNIKSHMNKIAIKKRMGKWESDQREAMWRDIRMEKKDKTL